MVKVAFTDPAWLNSVHVNKNNVDSQIKTTLSKNVVTSKENFNFWLLKAVSLIDLTTLSGDDTMSNVARLCVKASNPINPEILIKLGIDFKKLRTAAVCVYPNRVKDACETIKHLGLEKELPVASVATGFPSGLYPLNTRLQEIQYVISEGAREVDVVLDRSLVLSGQWEKVYFEVTEMKRLCLERGAHLKVILGVGELGSYENVYRASMVSMKAGADFIKTSTGKEAVNATLPVGLVMCRAIRTYYQMTGRKVGLKPAGGIKTAQDAVNWLILVHTELGADWLTPNLFRIGASSLLDVLELHLVKSVDGLSEKGE